MKVTWVLQDGRQIAADVKDGLNMMEAAVAANVPRVIGECGGSLACATCHVYVADEWAEKTGTPDRFEEGMLDVTEAERRSTSRLSCQIKASPALDGLVLYVPEP